MKSILLFCLIFLNLVTFSQGYQIADTTKTWSTIFVGYSSWMVCQCGGTEIIKLSDISNLGDQYLDVLETHDSSNQEWEIKGQLREDTLTHKVYYRSWETDTDGMIYDFSLEPGDTVLVDNHWWYYNIDTMICGSTDFVNINGEMKKRIYLFRLTNPYFPIEIWIEGIGSNLGLMYSGSNSIGIGGGSIELLCCTENGATLWMDSLYACCYLDTFYPRFLSYSYDTAFLNTYYEYKMPIDTGNANSILLSGEYIPEGFSFDPATGILSGTPSQLGAFECIITAANPDYNFLTDMVYTEIVVVLPTNTSNTDKADNINIFPNPFNSNVNLKVSSSNEKYYLELYTTQGKLVKEFSFSESTNINLNYLTPGIYMAKVINQEGKVVLMERMVKQ
ncbi:MAG: T9SS type A sorting domain-containing protein [Omnitrophica WOR_2 bacterium]